MSVIDNENLFWEEEVKLSASNEPIVVVCAADNNYAMPLAVTMRSALENLKGNGKIIFYIIDGGITNLNKQKILSSLILSRCEVKFVSISDSLLRDIYEAHKPLESANKKIKADYETSHVTITSFYRLIIPELLPNNVEKVIYLDCDLVVSGDLEELWQIDQGENHVLAVQDTWIPYMSSSTGKLNYQKLGIDSDSKYFNAGVLVVNLKRWRADKFSIKAINYFKQNLEYVGWYDQGVLNAMLVGKWGELDPRWNMSPSSVYGFSSWQESPFSEEVYNALLEKPYIIHFVSKKPWTSRHTLFKEYFFRYVDLTAWSGWRLTIWRRLWLRLIREFKTVMSKINHLWSS
jgi:lipopolysaccharide biosynthesis glycosyltransferase